MIITDLKYALENRLLKKLDLMIDRCTRDKPIRDAWMICEGGEGEGKTNASLAIAYYVKHKTQREINMFLSIEDAMEFGKRTEKKIIIIDEPSLDSLKGDGNNTLNRNFKRFMAVCRIKQHFVISNLTRFYIFNEYLVVDRCLGMIHMYSRREIEPGRFVYIKKSRLEALYRDWNSKHARTYRDHKSFGGSFPEIMTKHFDHLDITLNGKPHATYSDYNKAKGQGIISIGEQSNKSKAEIKSQTKIKELQTLIASLPDKLGISQRQLAKLMGINRERFSNWQENTINNPILLGKQGFDGGGSRNIIITGGNHEKNFPKPIEEEVNN